MIRDAQNERPHVRTGASDWMDDPAYVPSHALVLVVDADTFDWNVALGWEARRSHS